MKVGSDLLNGSNWGRGGNGFVDPVGDGVWTNHLILSNVSVCVCEGDMILSDGGRGRPFDQVG